MQSVMGVLYLLRKKYCAFRAGELFIADGKPALPFLIPSFVNKYLIIFIQGFHRQGIYLPGCPLFIILLCYCIPQVPPRNYRKEREETLRREKAEPTAFEKWLDGQMAYTEEVLSELGCLVLLWLIGDMKP